MLTTTKVSTSSFQDQKPGTSGLRKPTKTFVQPNYTENFIQAILNSEGARIVGSTIVVGGDGRYFLPEAVAKIISIAAGSKVSKLLIGQNGILSTPAVSCLIRKYKALGGIVLTASHNPGGLDNDFGIKYNGENGGPAPDHVTNKIFDISKELKEYNFVNGISVDITKIGVSKFKVDGQDYTVEVVDSVADYVQLMKEIFDFGKLKEFLKTYPILINSMNGVTGPYARKIFIDELGCPTTSVINATPLPDFGGIHPDPNLTYAADLLQLLIANTEIQFGAAYDGDGDRNMVLGSEAFFVNPSDSLAVILANLNCIKWFNGKIDGVARSMPTSMAVDRVAQKLGLTCYEVPTGWKYFGNLMDAGKISLCGEESFGTGSPHVREKDGIWASLVWLSLLSSKGTSVAATLEQHWKQFGRNYYGRHDYENVDSGKANEMMSFIEKRFSDKSALEKELGREIAIVDNFSFTDAVDGSVAAKQGLRLIFKDGSRVVWRLSGTGSQGATVRVYLERFDDKVLNLDTQTALKDMVDISLKVSNMRTILGVAGPTVIT